MRYAKLAVAAALSLAATASMAQANDAPKHEVAQKALAQLAERGDKSTEPRQVRAYFYGSVKNIAGVARSLEKDGWANVQEYPDPQKGPPFVVATRTMTGEPDKVMAAVERLEALASNHRVTLEALEVPPVR